MQTLRNKLSRHTSIREISGALIGMVILLILISPIYATADHLYERLSPADWWFQYDNIAPFHKQFKRGDAIEFISTAEYKRSLEVQWFDTLWCDTGDKHVRLNTQITPDQPTFKEKVLWGVPTKLVSTQLGNTEPHLCQITP